jgi:hypothetical protein
MTLIHELILRPFALHASDIYQASPFQDRFWIFPDRVEQLFVIGSDSQPIAKFPIKVQAQRHIGQ